MEFIIVFILLGLVGEVLTSGTIRGQHCDRFNVTCNRGEVILMQRAVYGRMDYGECIKRDEKRIMEEHLPHIFRCSGDILNYMTDKCSGEVTCNVDTLKDIYANYRNICSSPGYLEAEYECVRAHRDECTLNVSKSTSLISKSKTSECRIVKLRTDPNLSIELTTVYFLGHDGSQSSGRVNLGEVTGYDVDGDDDVVARNPVGYVEMEARGNGSFVGVPLKIESSSVEVRMRVTGGATKWMFKVKARGCDDYSPENETIALERWRNNVTLKCTSTGQTLTLFCSEDEKWIGNGIIDCKQRIFKESLFKAYSGVIIVSSVSLVFVVILLVVCVLLCRFKRRKLASSSKPPRKRKVAEFLYKEGDRPKDLTDNRFSTTAHQQLEPPGSDFTSDLKPQHTLPFPAHPHCPMHGFVDSANGKSMQFSTMGYQPHYSHHMKMATDGSIRPTDFTPFTMRYHHLPSHFLPRSAQSRTDVGSDHLPPQPPLKDHSPAYFPTHGPMHQMYYTNMFQPYTCNPYFGTMPAFGIYSNDELGPIYNTLDPLPMLETAETMPCSDRTPEPLSGTANQPTDVTMARKRLALSREDIAAAERTPWEEMK